MNTVYWVAHILGGGDDDGEGQHAGGGQPEVDYHYYDIEVSLTVSLVVLTLSYYKGRDARQAEIPSYGREFGTFLVKRYILCLPAPYTTVFYR